MHFELSKICDHRCYNQITFCANAHVLLEIFVIPYKLNDKITSRICAKSRKEIQWLIRKR